MAVSASRSGTARVVLNGRSSIEILNTYNEERLPNARALMKTTDRFFDLVASPAAFLSFVRIYIFPYVANLAFRMNSVKRFVFPRISQIAINYRHGTLSKGGDEFAIKAGERMPYFQVEGASVYEYLHAPKFHLLLFFDGSGEPVDLDQNLTAEFPDLIDSVAVPLFPNIAEIFAVKRSFMVLLRPDNHIGLISPKISFDEIKMYLNRILS